MIEPLLAYSIFPPMIMAALPSSFILARAFNVICGSSPAIIFPSYSTASRLPKGGLAITTSYCIPPSKGSVASCCVTSANPCSRRLSNRVSSSSLAWTCSTGTVNTNIPLPAVGSNTLPCPLPSIAKRLAIHAIGRGVEYCCILMRLLLRAAMVGCIS